MTQRLASNRLVAELQRKTQALFYGDTGSLLHDSVTGLDSYGNPTTTTTTTSVACAFTDKPRPETWRDYADIEQIDAEVMFSGATPVRGDRFTIMARWDDSSFTDATFDILDIRSQGTLGYVCALRKVQA